jgi:hypothetical protein
MTQNPEPEIAPPPENGTEALLEYSWASACDLRLFHFVIDLALRGDFVSHIARQALDGKKDYKAQTPAELAKTNPGSATTTLRQSSRELLEMFASRAVRSLAYFRTESRN